VAARHKHGATLFAYPVVDLERYGAVEFDYLKVVLGAMSTERRVRMRTFHMQEKSFVSCRA